MTVAIDLTGGESVLVWQTLAGVSFQTFDAGLLPLGSPTTVTGASTAWISATPLDNGGFTVVWDASAISPPSAQDYDADGQAVGSIYSVAAPPIAETAFSTRAQSSTAVLPDGGYVIASYGPPYTQHVQRYDAAANPVGPAFTDSEFAFGVTQIAVLASGDYAVSTVLPSNFSATSIVDRFTTGAIQPSGVVIDHVVFNGDFSYFPEIFTQSIAGLPNGGFVVSWTAQNNAPAQIYSQEFTAAGTPAGYLQVLGTPGSSPTTGYATTDIDVFPDGRYVISWTSPTGIQHTVFTQTGSVLAPGNNDLIATPDIAYILPIGPHDLTLTAAVSQSVVGNALGDVITSNDHGSTIIGGSGNDTLIAGHDADMLTGGGGADTFVFTYLPWNAGHITDFTLGADRLDLSTMLAAVGYAGNDAVKDGYVTFASDGSGDTQVYLNAHDPSNPWPTLITTLDHVAPAGLNSVNVLGQAGSSSLVVIPPSTTVETADIYYTVPTGVQNVQLTGLASQFVSANSLGDVITDGDHGSSLIGGSGNDTLIAGHGDTKFTGNGGANDFVFNYLPWNAGHITDFTVGIDKLDLTALFNASGYSGSDPIADGYLTFASDGSNGTKVYFDPNGPGTAIPILITTLNGVSPTGLTAADVLEPSGTLPPGTGLTLSANDTPGQTLTGGTQNDTLFAGHNSVAMTGGGGDDTFVFNDLPWNAGHITDFNAAQDVLDLRALFGAAGYAGNNPVADGYLNLASDGDGGTKVFFDPNGPGTVIPILVTTLDHVAPASLHAGDWLIA